MSLVQILAEGVTATLPGLVNANTCSGKTYIVTDGNHGLGLETARHLVGSSTARVILTVRNMKAGEKAKADIESSTGRIGIIELWHLDLSSFKSVKDFANKVSAELERIDAFVANAGVSMDSWEIAEGVELSMTVIVVNTMFLSVLIMPNTGSALGFIAQKELAKSGKLDVFRGLNDPQRANMTQRYALSKLVQLYASRELAAICPVERTGVTINIIAPGFCSMGLGHETSSIGRAMQGTLRVSFARTAEEGSRTILFGVVANEKKHGKLLSGCKIKEHWVPGWINNASGQALQNQIWRELVQMMEAQQPGCVSRISPALVRPQAQDN